jgi:hypothetical protein
MSQDNRGADIRGMAVTWRRNRNPFAKPTKIFDRTSTKMMKPAGIRSRIARNLTRSSDGRERRWRRINGV